MIRKVSKPRKLNLSLEKLIEIAKEINKNTLANKNRTKEEKIATDKFIRKFGISRKNFSETIKGTEIRYNKSTFLYNIPEVNSLTTKVNFDKNYRSSKKINLTGLLETKEVPEIQAKDIEDITISKKQNIHSVPEYILEEPQELKELLSLSSELKEMLNWYKKQSSTLAAGISQINLNNKNLQGEVITRSYKMYKSVADDFKKFTSSRKESVKDLVSLAILEFVDKYSK